MEKETNKAGKRIKTKYIGVYYRYSSVHVLDDGSPDVCYDINYCIDKKLTFEKVGWASEGYTVEDAISLRAERVKSIRKYQRIDLSKKMTFNKMIEIMQTKKTYNLKNYRKYISLYHRYIEKTFGNRYINDIKSIDVENFYVQLDEMLNARKENLSPSTKKDVLKFLKSIINKAILWGLVDKNMQNPVTISIKTDTYKRERYLTEQEAKILLDACQYVDCNIYYLSFISLYTGMRLGEILTLKKENVNLNENILIVHGKTGKRTVYINDECKPILKKLILRAIKDPDNSYNWLFTEFVDTNKHMNNVVASRKFAQIVKELGFNDGITDPLNKVVFHTLRHTFCSWLAIKGIPIYTISHLVGHKDQQMTQRYAKLSPESKKNALNALDSLFF